MRKDSEDLQEDLSPHTIREVTGSNEIGNHSLTGLMEGALEIFWYLSFYREEY